jgi:Family of unknown function (DUF6318)
MIDGGRLRWGLQCFVTMAGLLLIAGCTGDPAPDPTYPWATGTTTAPSAGSSTSPSAVSPSPTPVPTLPAAATKLTAAGATAFYRYWIDMYNYAYATADGAPFAALCEPNAIYCRTVVAIIDHDRQAKLRRIGGTVRIQTAEALQVTGDPKEGFVVIAGASQDAIQTLFDDGRTYSTNPASSLIREEVRVYWADPGWRVHAIKITRPGKSS